MDCIKYNDPVGSLIVGSSFGPGLLLWPVPGILHAWNGPKEEPRALREMRICTSAEQII